MSAPVMSDAVDDLVAVVQAGLDDLRTRVAAAELAADRAEDRRTVLLHTVDGHGGGGELLRSALRQVFVVGELQQDAAIEAAEAQAAARIAAARADAEELLLQAHVERARRLTSPPPAGVARPRPPVLVPDVPGPEVQGVTEGPDITGPAGAGLPASAAGPTAVVELAPRPQPAPSPPDLAVFGPTTPEPIAVAVPAGPEPRVPLVPADERGFDAFWREAAVTSERDVGRDVAATVFGVLGAVALLALLLVLVG